MRINGRTGQYTLYDGESIKLARTVMRVPEANKWDKEALSKVHVTQWGLNKPRDVEVVFKEQVENEGVDFDKNKWRCSDSFTSRLRTW